MIAGIVCFDQPRSAVKVVPVIFLDQFNADCLIVCITGTVTTPMGTPVSLQIIISLIYESTVSNFQIEWHWQNLLNFGVFGSIASGATTISVVEFFSPHVDNEHFVVGMNLVVVEFLTSVVPIVSNSFAAFFAIAVAVVIDPMCIWDETTPVKISTTVTAKCSVFGFVRTTTGATVHSTVVAK